MNHKIPFYSILVAGILSSCKIYRNAYTPTYPNITTVAVEDPGLVFYPEVRLPDRAFIEMGTFTLSSRSVPGGNVLQHLPTRLARQGFDGAIILDKQVYYEQDEESAHRRDINRYNEVTYMGFVYSENLDRLKGTLKEILIRLEEKDSAISTARVTFDLKRQINSVEGDKELYREARLIQPWFFLDQQNGAWKYCYDRGRYPDRIFHSGEEYYKFLFNNENPEWHYYTRKGEFGKGKTRLYLQAHTGFPVVERVVVGADVDMVYTVYEEERMKEQLWEQDTKGRKIHYIYSYRTLEDIPQTLVVYPDDLAK